MPEPPAAAPASVGAPSCAPPRCPASRRPRPRLLGLRSLAFEVEDLRSIIARLAEQGYGLVGGVGEHEGAWLMAYVRGPEGLIVALGRADRLTRRHERAILRG